MPTQTPLLVVGGGVVGLTTALFAAQHDLPCVLVERHPGLLLHPRSRGLTPRTMEVYRQARLEQPILDAAFAGPGFTYQPVQANTLADAEYRIPDEPAEDDGSGASPCGFGPIDQDKLEHLVRDKARALGAELRFHTELTSFTQDDDKVTAELANRQSGAAEVIEAGYLVAADGFGSPMRHALGIEADGPGPMFTTLTAIVEADLTAALRGRTVSIAYLQQPRPFTILMAHGQAGRRWVFGTGYDPQSESLADFTDQRVAGMVRAAAGLPSADVRVQPQIPGTDLKVLGFPIGAHVARRYRAGRVFLAGDAAHVWPPTGGLGANAGIQDAHNLAWKLAMVHHRLAGPALLDTYEQERHPVGCSPWGKRWPGSAPAWAPPPARRSSPTARSAWATATRPATAATRRRCCPPSWPASPAPAPRTRRSPWPGGRCPPLTCTAGAWCCSPGPPATAGPPPPRGWMCRSTATRSPCRSPPPTASAGTAHPSSGRTGSSPGAASAASPTPAPPSAPRSAPRCAADRHPRSHDPPGRTPAMPSHAKESNNDRAQDRDTGGVAGRPAGAAGGRKGTDPAQRRTGPAAPAAALGPHRQGLPVRRRPGPGVFGRPVRRALAAADLPLHARARLHRRVPDLLGDRRRLQRLGQLPQRPVHLPQQLDR